MKKNRQNNDAYKSEYSNWNQSYRIWIQIENKCSFHEFCCSFRIREKEGAQIISWCNERKLNEEGFLYFKKYRSNVELSLSTFWSWRHDSKSFMKPVLLTPGLSFGKTVHYKWNVCTKCHKALPKMTYTKSEYKTNYISYISSGQQWKSIIWIRSTKQSTMKVSYWNI